MSYLLLGLIIFLGVHSLRIFADNWRTQRVAAVGELTYKGLYSVASLAGFVLIVLGFGVARETPSVLWTPPMGMRHAASLLTLIAFVFLAAAYIPGNAIKARVHHPMVLAVKTWAAAHLLANGTWAHVVLFGAFLAWAVLDYVAARRRDRVMGTTYPAGSARRTWLTVEIGTAAWVIFAFWAHGLLIGIRPFG